MILNNTISSIFLLICIFACTIVLNDSIQDYACQMEMARQFSPHLFKIDGRLITTTKFITSVYSVNKECMLEAERLLEPYKFDNITIEVGMIHLECKNNSKVLFNLTETETFQNIVGYFYSFNCSFERENLLQFLNILNFRVLILSGLFLDSISNQGFDSSVLDKIVSLGVLKPKNHTNNIIDYLFGHKNHYKNMGEIILSDSPMTINLSTFVSKFPKLQSLEITDSAVEDLDTFPWTYNNVSFLPDGLWRSDYFQDHYVKVFHVLLQGNIFKRSLRLSNCKISDLKEIFLKGELHQIDLASNSIKRIGQNTFHSVFGLQSLVLRDNMLSNIQEGVFDMQKSMTYLDISDNQLSNLSATIFSGLEKLEILNLANNLIISLPEGIFFNLNNLNVLHLENNSLTSLGPRTLPYFSVKLHSIFLNSNPLNIFPVSCFYIRSLRILELKNTHIAFSNFTSVFENIDYHLLRQSVVKSASVGNQDPTESPNELRIIDLTGSRVRSFQTNVELSAGQQYVMVILLKHFRFILIDNPLTCDCSIIPLNTFMKNHKLVGTWNGNEYFFKEWTCKYPRQFVGEPMLLLKDEDTYCEISDTLCPLECKCYKRYNRNVTIVDCFESGLDEFPKRLPHGILDLWINNNNISTMPSTYLGYLKRVQWLDLSNNKFSEIKESAFKGMANLKRLILDNNKLSYLPSSLKHLNLQSFSVKNNRLRCDCYALKSKYWLLSNLNIIENAKSITCLEGEQKPIVSTPDKDFVCTSDKEFLNLSILIPAIASVFVIIILLLFLCVYRFEIKVILYIHCGLHPFDKLTRCEKEIIDYTMIYSKENENFVRSNIISCLQERGYNLLDIHENFLAGYSFQENISSAVQISKHVLVVLSEQMLNNSKLLNIVWSECQNKIEKYRTNFVILACHDLKRFKIQNKAVTRYLKQNRCLNTKSALFLDKISYYLPKKKLNIQHNMNIFHSMLNESRCMDRIPGNEYDIFVSYSEEDGKTCNSLLCALEESGYGLCLPDRDFVPGTPMTHNIVDSINKSTHTILLTRGYVDEEQTFVYRTANEKSLRCKYNHLIVIFLENNGDISLQDKDIEKYISSYITLRLSDPKLLLRLKNSLSCPHVTMVTNDTDISVILDQSRF